MAGYGNDPSSGVALGLDVGSTNVKAAVVSVANGVVSELATAHRAVDGCDAAALVETVAQLAAETVSRARIAPAVIGIASQAETGVLVGDRLEPVSALHRWDDVARSHERFGLDPTERHLATGAPLSAKTPILRWATLAREGLPPSARWAFVMDLVGASLTGRLATDHTIAGRSGALDLPPPGAPIGTAWDDSLLTSLGIPRGFAPPILLPSERLGTVADGRLRAVTGATSVRLVGHDHAVTAWLGGMREPGTIMHSLGTSEAVLGLSSTGVDRRRAAADGISVVRAVDGRTEGVLAGSPSAGRLIASWTEAAMRDGVDTEAALRAIDEHGGEQYGFALPYARGRQCPAPDPDATLEFIDTADDRLGRARAILRGIAAHGAWMRDEVAELTGAGVPAAVRAAGTPVARSRRLASLMAATLGRPIDVLALDAPAASGAAALAGFREGLWDAPLAPTMAVQPDDDGYPDLRRHFAAAVHTLFDAEGARR